jgi:cell division protein FtsW
MGETTFVKPRQQATNATSKPRSLIEGFDLPLIIGVVTLYAIGLLFVYSSSWEYSAQLGLGEYDLIVKQFLFGIAGGIVALLISYFNYHRYQRWVVIMMIVMVVLLIWGLLTPSGNGTKRSLLNGSIQPSELAKMATIIYLAFWLYSKKDQINNISFGLAPLGIILGIVGGLIFAQPDVSAAITIFALGVLMFFLAGGDWKQLILLAVITVVFGFLVYQVSSRVETRMADYINGFNNPTQASDHLKWSMQAIINGGVFGVGIGRGTAKFEGLPVAPTDSIFAVIAEETGLIGVLVVIGLYLLILWRGIRIAQHAPDLLGKLLAGGVTFWLLFEACVNMGVLVNLLPFAGNALPLVSAGGSNLLVTFTGIGILLNVARTGTPARDSKEGSVFSAVVDLRWRDRRRRVPRSNRSANSRR